MSVNNDSMTKLSKVQLELCQMTFDYLWENGCWPKSRKLHVDFRKKGDLWGVAGGIDWRILTTGDKYQAESETKLTVEGISLCIRAEETLSLFIRAIKVFVDFYIRNPEAPKVTFEELTDLLGCDDRNCTIACILLSGEPRLFSSYSGLSDGRRTNFKLVPDVLRYEHIVTINDYLKIIRDERKPINELDTDLQNILLSYPSTPTEVFSQELFLVIPEIVKDERLVEIILQDIEETQCALSKGLWKSVRLLCGSACEGILLSALGSLELDGKEGKKQINYDYNLSKLIQKAIKLGILNARDAKLADYIRDSRNVIHPSKAIKDGIINKSTAIASYALLGIICEAIQNNRFR